MAGGALTAERVEGTALRFLDLRQVRMIDDALANLGEFGEIRLVIQKGQLRYLVTQRSYDASKWDGGRAGRTRRGAD
jgi:hypothetical protein